MTLVAAGNLGDGWRHFATFPFLAGTVGAVISIALWVTDEEVREDGAWGPIFVTLLFFAFGLAASLSILVPWMVCPARVRYLVDGTKVVACRGDRVIAAVDVREAESIRVVGYMSTRRFYVTLRPIYSPLSNLPQVVCTIRTARERSLDVCFPRVLIWGRQEAATFRSRLESELLSAGVDRSTLSLDNEF